MWEIMPLIIWAIAGGMTLMMKEVPKILYGLCWFCLMFELAVNCIEQIK